jgi:hypothetical protein
MQTTYTLTWIVIEHGKLLEKIKNFRQRESWFDEGCSKLLNERKQAKLQRLYVTSEIDGDNLNYIRHGVIMHFWNKI